MTDNRGVERPVDVMRMKKFVKHTHPTVVEGDYADHFATAGEALTTECNRGRAPENEHREDEEEDEDERGAEQQAAEASQEADSPDSMPASQAAEQADDTQDSEEEQNTPATQVLGSGDEQGSGWEEGGGLDLGGEAAESESEAGDGEAIAEHATEYAFSLWKRCSRLLDHMPRGSLEAINTCQLIGPPLFDGLYIVQNASVVVCVSGRS